MSTCQGKLLEDKPCPEIVEEGQTYCRWHDPEDESWREIYEQLEKATTEDKRDIVLKLIEEHPEHRLVLPKRGSLGDNFCANLQEVNFIGVNLREADLSGANLQKADLRGNDLQKAILKEANLQEAVLLYANLQEANLISTNLQGAILWNTNLQKADLLYANLQEASLFSTNLQGAKLPSANLQDAELIVVNLQGADLRRAKLQNVDLSDAEDLKNAYFSDAWFDRTRLRKDQLGGAIGEELEGDYSGAKRGYLALKQNFDELGDYDAVNWAYRKERRMEKLESRENGLAALSGKEVNEDGKEFTLPLNKRKWGEAVAGYSKYLGDTFVEWLCDYGESVWRVIGWMIVLLFIGGPILFSVTGGFVWKKELMDGYFAISSPWLRFWYSYRLYLLYTLDTMTTANFSGLQPSNDAVKFASGFFATGGIFLTGLLGFVAGNRIRRS